MQRQPDMRMEYRFSGVILSEGLRRGAQVSLEELNPVQFALPVPENTHEASSDYTAKGFGVRCEALGGDPTRPNANVPSPICDTSAVRTPSVSLTARVRGGTAA